MKRQYISLKEKLAAALYECARLSCICCPGNEGSPVAQHHLLVTALLNKRKSADDLIRLFNFDHVAYHADGGPDLWWNLTPMPAWEHLEKTKKDIAVIAKGKRIRRKQAVHKSLMSTEPSDLMGHLIDEEVTRLQRERKARPALRVRPWPYRPFPKRKKKVKR